MKKAYILAYDDSLGTRDEIKAFLNSMPEVSLWRYDMPHCFYVISESSADELSKILRSRAGDKGRHVFVEFAGNEQGWLTGESWYIINNKQVKPKQT